VRSRPVLGESVLLTGATFSNLTWTASTVAGVAVSFAGTAASWSLFVVGAVALIDAVLSWSAPAAAPGSHIEVA
jgi:hypothetical protein